MSSAKRFSLRQGPLSVHDVAMQLSRILSNSAAGMAAALLLMLAPAARARHSHTVVAGGTAGQFDYYLLALSWSPSYCRVHPADRYQCQRQGFGFVLHGLWPQFDAGGYPQACATDTDLDRAAEAVGRTLYPSPKLMRHEWERHGTCSGLGPGDYFRTADRALAVVHIPAPFAAPRADRQLSPQQIRDAFRAANPALPPHSMTVACGRGELSEVRLCLTRNLQPRACGRGVRDSCPPFPVSIPSAR
jgi:ribonuclease T2